MAYTRVIPSYDLYGDQASEAWSQSFNFEWIPQRSRLYQWVIQPHRHEAFIQVLYLTRGEVDMQLDDQRVQAQAPCILLVPAGHVHGFRFTPDIDGPVVTATQRALESMANVVMPELLQTIRQPQVIALQPEGRYVDQLMPLFLTLEQEFRNHAPGHLAASTSLLLALVVQVNRLAAALTQGTPNANAPSSRKARQMEKFRQLVDRHFRTEHSVQLYASELGVTPGQLARLSREVLGMPTQEVINARILHEAQRDLVYTSLPIKQLAADLGFDDDAYFSRFFRKHTGTSPKSFRAQALRTLQEKRSQAPPDSLQILATRLTRQD